MKLYYLTRRAIVHNVAVKQNEAAKKLVAVIDGGDLKSKDSDAQSFEAMIATVFRPENLRKIDKRHYEITRTISVASALSDHQKTIKKCNGLAKEHIVFYKLEHHVLVKLGIRIGKKHRKEFIQKPLKKHI